MKKIVFIIIFSCFIFGCSDSTNCGCAPPPIQGNLLDVALKDASGNFLIDSPNYASSNFEISYLLDNIQQVPNNNWRPSILDYEGKKFARIILNNSESNGNPTTYIKWNNIDTDTITVKYNQSNTSKQIEKIWVNNEVKEIEQLGSKRITIKK